MKPSAASSRVRASYDADVSEAILMALNGRGDAGNDLEGPGAEVLADRSPARADAA